MKGENLGTCHSWLQTQSATGRRPDEVHDHAHRGHRCEQWQRARLYRRGRRRPRPRARAGAKFAAIGTAAPGLALIIRPVNHGGGDLQYTWRLEPRGSRPATCCHSLVRLARGAVQFKYQNLQLPHALSCLAISCCTACFAIFWWNDTKLSGTIFPRIFWLRLGLYGGSALFELGIFLLFRFAPQHACKHAVAIHMLFCEWMAVILSFDPHRVIALVSPDTSYARELAQWWALYNPDPGSFKTECGGYVIDGEQLCYFNSFEAIYLIMIMCVMAVSGFYFRVPPCSFLVQVHLTIATRIAIVSVYGSVNTKSTVDIMDTVCFSVGLLLLYFAVRRNDAQHRATFFQLQLTRQEMGESTERLTGEKERLAWELNMTVSRLVQQPERDGSGCGSGRALEDDDGAPAAALMSLPVAVHANGHEEEEEPVVEATRVGRWAGEITLFYPTTTTLGEDTISLWTDANEADFRDSMFHSGFKWRVSMVAAVAVVVLTVLLLDSCLTVQGAFTMSIQAVMLLTEVVAQRMADRRRARELGVGSIICLFIAFGIGSCFTANLAASGDTPTWDGAQCTNERLATRTMQLYNLLVGPCGVFIGVLVTSMTISVGGFVALFVGYLVPCAAAYLLVGLSLPDITVDGSPLTPMPGVIVGAAFIFGCYFAGVVIGGIYTFLQRRAAITTAEVWHTPPTTPCNAPPPLLVLTRRAPLLRPDACRASQRTRRPACEGEGEAGLRAADGAAGCCESMVARRRAAGRWQ